jgi:tetratricopeptide (TPR) repeat protein
MTGEVQRVLADDDAEREPDDVWTDNAGDQQAPDETPEPAAAPLTFWDRIRYMLGPSRTERVLRAEHRLHDLDDAIARNPDEAANYVLRGELALETGQPELAAADFQRALELAHAAVEKEEWGLVAQVMQDRALVGLRSALRRTGPRNTQEQT